MIFPEDSVIGQARILISACLLGAPVRWDGSSRPAPDPRILAWQQLGWLLPLCPEMEGGLGCPRPPAEISTDAARVLAGHGSVFTADGADVGAAFIHGARRALHLVREHDLPFALLKARSPSCGPDQVYDGHFRGQLRDGAGLTAHLLRAGGVEVFDESPAGLEALTSCLSRHPAG